MKWGSAIALLALATGHATVLAARLGDTPMAKVVTLLKDMKTKINTDGKSEQASYDKYACWCEDTLSEKAESITKAKDKLEDLQNNINKHKGGLGSGGATIAQLNKDIGENKASQKEATEVRDKENSEYEEEKISAEQCIGALEMAIKVLTGAGAKKGFLETLQEAQILSVMGGMRSVLKAPAAKKISNKDLEVVEHFVQKPEDFMKGHGVAAMQTANNPFGDYAPQSSQIQGILKSMYDSFTSDLEKDNAEEAEKQKGFEELMATKKKELNTLEGSLDDETEKHADSTKSVADDKAMRADTQDQLESDTAFFTATKEACSKKATQWATRSRLRTKEVAGITEAIKILDSDEAKKTFKEAQKSKNDASFLQLSSSVHPRGTAKRAGAYKKLKALAARHHSLQLAQIAIAAKTGGHFDDVIVMIDKMVATLRVEEQDDIEHRDRCEGKTNANTNSIDDAEHDVQKAQDEIDRLDQAMKDKKAEIKELDDSMKATKKTMDDITTQREKETAEFKKMQKADQDSIDLLQSAQNELKVFYRDTKALLEVDAKPQPETNWQGGDTEGSKGEARGVMGIIEMLMDDLKKEMKSQGQDEIDAQTAYEEDFTDLTRNYRSTERAKTKSEVEWAGLKSDKQDQTDTRDARQKDKDDEEELQKTLKKDCKWVADHFEKRRNARKAEIDGLVDAKDFLAGVGTDSDLDMP